ncbi:hypothetical protein GO495_22650 [Chitinophaga oryziterrae]|uniref:MotA/TolQ/ExbB proton channel domain-containing protein n=1 Tax=Chitinophaga oryziterrae TaxID=1031224 RepID=A0A6N8JGG6_9BACT|nr:hypothetical protein [Chitinophaga oryziterrae]MVT43416.1 hypothetical protein [Chitinophaga oryziterrae]
MNSVQAVEIFGAISIIGLQITVFLRTLKQIRLFEQIFPSYEEFEVINVGLARRLFQLHPNELLNNINKYVGDSDEVREEVLYVDLMLKKDKGNKVTDKIVRNINTYLLRNRGVAADFHLIKDVVERNVNVVENDIQQSVSLPLYLGLLGTFMGIVLGLMQISGESLAGDPSAAGMAIHLLLGGVKIAMIASFTGLLCTLAGNSFFFKRAKRKVEDSRNEFYTFIQTDLMPLLNQNINSTLYSLQNNLHKFNDEFKSNVYQLSGAMGKHVQTIESQERILDTLNNMDVVNFANANVVILKELQASMTQFKAFNEYVSNISELVGSTRTFAEKIGQVMTRTDELHVLGDNIISVFTQNRELMQFLRHHYSSLDDSHQLITKAVNGVSNTLDSSLQLLKDFTQERIVEIQQLTLKEIDQIKNDYYEKWKHLEKLGQLEIVNKHLVDLKRQGSDHVSTFDRFNEQFAMMTAELNLIKRLSENSFSVKVTRSFTKLLGKKTIT